MAAALMTFSTVPARGQEVSPQLNEHTPKRDTVRRELRLALADSPMWRLEHVARLEGAFGAPQLPGEIGRPARAAVGIELRRGEAPELVFQGPDGETWPYLSLDSDAKRLLERQLSYATLLRLVDTLTPQGAVEGGASGGHH
jgi:hypothetical protein